MKDLRICYHDFWISYHSKKSSKWGKLVEEMEKDPQYVDPQHPRFAYGSYKLRSIESKVRWFSYHVERHRAFKNKYEVAEK